ncbi:CubicO group peptidase, beta-lactamase class C family [bacterium A37T11]|nr:CubicO group peptidase, beta-lactamase class C family [bacterium A37T11]
MNRYKVNRCFVIVIACLMWMQGATAQADKIIPPDMDSYLQEVLEKFQVPGIAVGIVKDGKIWLAKGYGIKKLGSPEKVDENTLFNIASNTKAFTSTSLAMLVEEGKLNWEDKVIEHLPWFRMSDDYVTMHLTVRDLLVHQSGLPSYVNDLLLFPPSLYTREELLRKLKDIPLQYDFRTVYAYDNILYLAAGEIIKKVSGMEWEDFVKTRIFDVVGMKNSVSRYSTLKDQPNFAVAHARRKGQLKSIDNFYDLNIGDVGDPAGGISSSALDMSKWLITQLDSGMTPEHGRIFTPDATKQLWKIIRPMPITKEPVWLAPNQRNFSGYALGFRTYDYRGHQVVGHGGLLTGFVSQIAMLPELKLGVVVLTNQLSGEAFWSIINHIVDYNLGVPAFDWVSGYKKSYDKDLAASDSTSRRRSQIKPDSTLRMSLPLEKYTGAYTEPLIGDVIVDLKEKGLYMRFPKAPKYDGYLTHFQGDLFVQHYQVPNMGDAPYVNFIVNPDHTIREIRFISNFNGADNEFERLLPTPNPMAILDTTTLRKRILAQTAKFPKGHFAVAYKDLQTGETFFLNEKDSFHAASTMKTPVMAEVFEQADKGKFSISDSVTVINLFKSIVDGSKYSQYPLNDSEQALYKLIGKKTTIDDLLQRMITRSSNLATNNLVNLVGAKNVMKMMKGIGAKDIKVLRGVEDSKAYEKGLNNTTTAYDLMLIFEKMAQGTLVNKQSSDAMIAILKNQYFKSVIPARLPANVKVAHKTGGLPLICHDSGIVYLPDGRKYVLVLLSGDVPVEQAKKPLSLISEFFYEYIKGK